MKPNSKRELQLNIWELPEDQPEPFRKAVQIVLSKPMSSYSLVQRKMTNVCLKNASENPIDADGYYSIPIKKMMSAIGYVGNNRDHVKNSAKDLMRVAFKWDILAADSKNSTWEASVLFPSVSTDSSQVRYKISPQFKDLIGDPAVYAMIDTATIKKFSRSSSVALYDYCIRFE